MLLIITNSRDATADYLVEKISAAGIEFVRLDSDRATLATRVGYSQIGPRLAINGRWVQAAEINAIWYRRPEVIQMDDRGERGEALHAAAEWAGALEGVVAHVPSDRWINHPGLNAGASNKLEQLTRANGFGLTIPDTIVTQDIVELRHFWDKCHHDVLAKPISHGYIERDDVENDTLIYTNRVTHEMITRAEELTETPTLFQQIVPKSFDARLTIVDNRFSCVAIAATETDGTARLDIRRNEMRDVLYSEIHPPQDVLDKVFALLASYKLRFAAVDFAVSMSGEWVFLEINPNGQWAWLDIEAQTDIAGHFLHAFSTTRDT